MRRLSLSILVALLLAACGDPRTLATASFRAGMERASPELYHALRDGLPQDYARLEQAAVDRQLAGMPVAENQRIAVSEFAQIINSHAGDAMHAPSADIAATARSILALAQALQPIDVEGCALVVNGGAMPLNQPVGSTVQRAAAMNNLTNIRAIIAGRTAHAVHPPPSQAVVLALVEDFRRRGGSEQWLRELGPGPHSLSAADQCRNFILFQTLLLERGDEVTASLIVAGHQGQASQSPDSPAKR